MATRLYLQSSGTAAISSPAIADGGWERNRSDYFLSTMNTTKQNTALVTKSAVFGATVTSQTRIATFVSDTLSTNQTISGTFSLVIGKCAETSAYGDAHLAYTLRVVDGITGAHKANLATLMGTSKEFPLIASAATRIVNAAAITSYNASAGDRLVLEVGIHGVTPANEKMQMRFGDPAATSDFALTAGLTTDLVPWGEISVNLTFGKPPPDPNQFVETTDAGNSIATATAVGPSYTSIKGYFTTVEKSDYFALQLKAGQSLAATMTLPSGVDWDLKLYNAAGATLASSTSTKTTETVYYTNNTGSDIMVYLNPYVYSGSSSTPYIITLTYNPVNTSYDSTRMFLMF